MRVIRLLVLLMIVPAILPAQAGTDQLSRFRQESAVMAAALDDAFSSIVPGPLLQRSKATQLDGYGLVVTVEVALEPPRNPFSGVKQPEEIRRSSAERREALKEKAVELLQNRVAGLASVGSDERVAIVIHLLNTNPADLPDLPTQVVVSVGKQAAADLEARRISPAAFRDRVNIREY